MKQTLQIMCYLSQSLSYIFFFLPFLFPSLCLLLPPLLLSQGSGPEDFSHLPPEQRRKKLQGKLDELNKDIQKEMDQRYLLEKKGCLLIYNKNSKDHNNWSCMFPQGRSNQDERCVREEPADGRPNQCRPPALRNSTEHWEATVRSSEIWGLLWVLLLAKSQCIKKTVNSEEFKCTFTAGIGSKAASCSPIFGKEVMQLDTCLGFQNNDLP